ncbi:MAG: hypothetical protein LAT63_09290 [Marinobacter sp.]|nr:hypothetical protein [Marinobacter sp.]
MISSVVVAIEITLAGLLMLLAFRIINLAREQEAALSPEGTLVADVLPQRRAPMNLSPASLAPSATGAGVSERQELTANLHILASLQLRDSRMRGLDIIAAPLPVRGYTAAWFYGAACALLSGRGYSHDSVIELISPFLARTLGMGEMAVGQSLHTVTHCSSKLGCFRLGVDGANTWLRKHYVTEDHSLYSAVTTQAFV